jgi:hypothetical protein
MENDGTLWNTMEHDGTRWKTLEQYHHNTVGLQLEFRWITIVTQLDLVL